ncbi:MAG TPA: hypothetical protein VFO60_07755 [Candidatus Dormibacteraeota bacterium]|nr:hypothetical protein [Candidatus Dormibacteraeota bacterium]
MSESPVLGLGTAVCPVQETHHVHWRGNRTTGRGALMCNICGTRLEEVPTIGQCSSCGRAQILPDDGVCRACGAAALAEGFTGPVD